MDEAVVKSSRRAEEVTNEEAEGQRNGQRNKGWCSSEERFYVPKDIQLRRENRPTTP